MLLVPTARRRRVRSVIGAVLASLALVAVALVAPSTQAPANAADLSKFDPGNIISDAVFFDKNAMSEAQIQTFLQARVPTCAASATCLKSYTQPTTSKAADQMCGAYAGASSERASRIIWKVAQACGVNPRVILVMLQKEQGLVTSVWPSTYAYQHAMGANCPDTTGCSAASAGFFTQVYTGVWQLKRYANPPGTSQFFTWYAPGKTWSILYNPKTSCGTKSVTIKNQATANLYYYTPYTPNAAALKAGYGTGDSCSSYGNRNFYNYFTDWFGSTQGSTAPSTPAPALASLDGSRHVLALDGAGGLWAYPFSTPARWGARVSVATGLTGYHDLVAVGDLDGDGHRDLVALDAAGAPWLLRSNGAKAYYPPTKIPGTWPAITRIAAAGDFDGDGIPDLFTLGPDGRLLLWPGIGQGSFRAPVVVAQGWGNVDTIIGGVDLSGDGRVDVVARNTDGDLILYPGNGTGGIGAAQRIGIGWGGMTAIVIPGDFTGDKRADILARDSAGALRLFVNVGAGAVTAGDTVGAGWQGMASISGEGPAPTGVRVFAGGAGDLNGDKAGDVLARTSSGSLLLYPTTGTGSWGARTTVSTTWGASTFVTMGDFNGDGRGDIGSVGPDGVLYLHTGNGEGGFNAPVRIGAGWGSMKTLIGGIDFDGDRKIDLLAVNSAGKLLLYRGNGAGGWLSGSGTAIGSGWGGFTSILYAGDFDGDKRADIVARDANGTLWLYGTTGTGGWLARKAIGSGWQGFDAVFSPGNFDGAGGPDLIARRPNGQLVLYKGDGRGGWSGSAAIGQGWNIFTQIG